MRAATLALAALATGSAELAIAEPGTSPPASLARAAALALVAAAVFRFAGRTPRAEVRRSPPGGPRAPARPATGPLVVVGLLIAFALPFAVEAGRMGLSGRTETLEVVLLSALRNLGLGLAALARRPAFARLAALVSLFLVLISSSLAEGAAALALLGGYAVVGGLWLSLSYWKGLRLPAALDGPRRVPIATLVQATALVGVVSAIAAVGPTRAATALAGFMPSSGGTDWELPDARSGVNDGENEVGGAEKPRSIGFADTDTYLESDKPSLYDAFNDMYGEPIKPNKRRDRMVGLNNQKVIEQKESPAENLRAGREFSAVRRRNERAGRRPGDRGARALLYVKGPTPLHIGLAAFDRFDGREWREAPTVGLALPARLEPGEVPWFRLDPPVASVFTGTASHQVKVGLLDSAPLPVPPHVARFRVGQVNRLDFFGWSHEGMVRMVGRAVPASTVVEAESLLADPRLLRATTFPDGPYAARRLQTLDGERRIAPGVAALARSWVEGADRGWGQVEAVVANLRGHAVHDRGATAPPDCDDVVADFLLESRRGPDYLFATSAAVLLRSLGYPTRLVSGFYAAPDRYDARTRHTPVTRDGVHVWAEVRLPSGTWIAIEPTPGYELMGPAIPWAERAVEILRSTWGWARARRVALILIAAALALLVRLRRDVMDGVATLAWRASAAADARRCAIEALRLVEKRSSWAGRPRPSGRTPRLWYGTFASPAADGDDLEGLIRLAEWGLYAPGEVAPPTSRGEEPRDACRRAVDSWTLRRFRTAARSDTQEEPVK